VDYLSAFKIRDMKKPEKLVMTFEAFDNMLQDLYEIEYRHDYINPPVYYLAYISAEADADNTVNGIMAFYDTVETGLMFDTDFLDCMVQLQRRLQVLDDFGIKEKYRLN